MTFEHIPFSPKPNKEAYEIAMQRATAGLPEGILNDPSVKKRIYFADDKLDNVQTPQELFGWRSVFVNEDLSKKDDAKKAGIHKTIQTIYELEQALIDIEHQEEGDKQEKFGNGVAGQNGVQKENANINQ